MKKIIVLLAVAAALCCSCAKGAKCECKLEATIAGSTTTTDPAYIVANDDETCAEAAKRFSKDTGDLGVKSVYSNCKAVEE